MTDFKTVRSSAAARPAEIDTESSAFYVYERRNIRQEQVNIGVGEDVQTVTEWVYEQREYTKDEYATAAANQKIMDALAEIKEAVSEINTSGSGDSEEILAAIERGLAL